MYNLENPYVNEKLDQVYPVVKKKLQIMECLPSSYTFSFIILCNLLARVKGIYLLNSKLPCFQEISLLPPKLQITITL